MYKWMSTTSAEKNY